MNEFDRKFTKAIMQNTNAALAIGYIRYEAVRALNTRRFAALNSLNMQGQRFDDLVDRLIEEGHGFLDEVEV